MRIWLSRAAPYTIRYPSGKSLTTSISSSARNILHPDLVPHHWQLKTLHLFRALLRECTYLPDPAARRYLPRYVQWSFRRTIDPRVDYLAQASPTAANAKRLGKAADELLYLRRANAAHPRQLTKVLEITYGRTRRRRYELLEGLTIPSSTIIDSKSNEDISRLTPQLTALLRSQAERGDRAASRGVIKNPTPKIPEKNVWARPMPMKRLKNMKKRWYANALERVQPPLPKSEWERLGRLASGEEKWKGPVPRRKAATSVEGKLSPILPSTALGGQAWNKPHMTASGISRPHNLTPRLMRRLWSKILLQCPTMIEDEGRWTTRWSDVERERAVGAVLEKRMGTALLQGVDSKGKVKKVVDCKHED